MKEHFVKHNAAAVIGLLLTAPTACFIIISVLKYVFHLPAMFDASQPVLEAWGIKRFGWNINLLILLGPLVACLLNLASVLQVHGSVEDEQLLVEFRIQRRILQWTVILLSAACLVILFLYALGENCNC